MQVPEYINPNWYEPHFSEIIRRFRSGEVRPQLEVQIPDMPLSTYIHTRMTDLGYTINQFADVAGWEPDVLKRILYDQRMLRHTEVKMLARALKTSEELLHRMIKREMK